MSDPKEAYTLEPQRDVEGNQGGHVNIGFDGLELGNDKKLSTAATAGTEIDLENKEPLDDEEPVRDQWSNPIEFLLSCISMSVGVGNIWRFPYTAYSNGGGAFLIPYLIVLIFIGRPIYFLELALGQFSQYGQVKIWNLSPVFTGVGYGSMIGTMCVVSYYASIMGLTVFYFAASMQATLPWSECKDDWVGLGAGRGLNDTTGEWESFLECNTSDLRSSYFINGTGKSSISVPQLYFENDVLKQKDEIDDGIGFPEWRLTLCLLLSWILICASIIKGVSSSGKVAYFTAIFPYVVLTIMLIRGATLEGAWVGIRYFIEPQWEKMLEAKVWYAAVGQCFFSLATGFGPIVMYASYNPFSHNIYRDAWIVSAMDTFTSLFAGFTIFSVLGNLSVTLDIPIDKVAASGNGLAFVSFAQGLSQFDWAPQFFAVLFFLMLFTLGIGSAVSLTGGIITIICDEFPHFKRWIVTSLVCFALFLIGLIYVTPGGQFMLEMVDHFGANFVIFVMATLEVMGVAWVYGVDNFIKDIEFMLGFRIGRYWRVCWGFITPVSLAGILIYALATEKRFKYNGWDYPDIALACGWMIAVVAVLLLPLCGLLAVKRSKAFGFINKCKDAAKPTPEWGPRSKKTKREWIAFKAKQL